MTIQPVSLSELSPKSRFVDFDHDGGKLPWTGDFQADYSVVADYIIKLDAVISNMPAPSERTGALRDEVRKILDFQDVIRSQFLATHVNQVYMTITNNFSDRLTVTELCERGVQKYPSLLPSENRMKAELVLPLGEREGREFSQALFVSMFLRDVACGKHLLASMRRPSARAPARVAEFLESGFIDLGVVTIERRGSAAVITLQNGASLNAEDLELLNQLELAVDIALLCPEVSAGVFRGGVMTHPKYRGRRVFCAGMNLRKLSSGQIPIVEYLISREMGLIEKIRRGLFFDDGLSSFDVRSEKPWLGVVEGFAIGGGLQMLLCFDKVIATDEVYFSLPAANEGIVPGSANFRLPRQVGARLARRMILLGEKVYAISADGKRICDDVIESKAIEAAIDLSLSQLSSAAVSVNRHMLNIADEPEEGLLRYLAEFCVVQAKRALSEDVVYKVKDW